MASSSASLLQKEQGGSRTGFFLRQRALAAANKVVSAGSVLVASIADKVDDDGPSKPSLYTEERCLVFPGSAYVKQGQLTVGLEGFAYGLRPLESASRTQKLFVSAARQLASLPTIPKAPAYEESLDIELPPEEIRRQSKDYNERNKEAQLPGTHPSLSSAAVQRIRPNRSNTASSMDSLASVATTATTSSVRPSSVKFSNASLETLHENLHTRLRLFFSQKLDGRRIRVSVFLVPKTPEAHEQCIAKGMLVSEVGGVFKSSITVPWTQGEPEGRRLRIRTELLTEQLAEETIDDQASLEKVMNRSDEATVTIAHAHAPIRVISDIDDTIKATHVLGGIKAVFRNVFTRPHEELTVEGMKDWYQEMHDQGTCFHYVSNSPFELFGVLREYLKVAGYPPGSIRLKEYGGGSSLLGGLWEPAGQRKRNGVEEVLRTFTDSRFLLVGDSGEQDLELYASLSAQFPRQILGIFIRDVTTPTPHGSTSVQHSPIERLSLDETKRPVPPKRRNSEAEQEKLLAQIAKEKTSTRPTPSAYDGVLELDDFNPLSDNVEESSYLAPLDDQGYTEMERKVLVLFRDRLARAQQEIPKGITLKIFKHGDECRSLAKKLMTKSDSASP